MDVDSGTLEMLPNAKRRVMLLLCAPALAHARSSMRGLLLSLSLWSPNLFLSPKGFALAPLGPSSSRLPLYPSLLNRSSKPYSSLLLFGLSSP